MTFPRFARVVQATFAAPNRVRRSSKFLHLLLAALGLSVIAVRSAAAVDVNPEVLKSEAARVAAAARAIPSVLAIFANGGQGGGSGVVISPDGFALSNFHVTKPCGNHMKCGMADGKLYDAVIVGLDPVGDVALIKLFGRNDFPTAELGDSDKVQVGDWCFAMGNPFLLATDFRPTVSYGVVSGVHRYQYPAGTLLEYADCIQTDAAINPGNSGGPLFDSQGRLIGINGRGSFEKRGRVNVGVGYAISINQIKNFLGVLKSGRIVDHATLGAQLGTSEAGRVVVTNIIEDSDAFRRGLRVDDEIVSFAGRSIRSVNAFKNVLGTLPRDWRVPLTYRREGKTAEMFVRLKGVHRRDELIAKTEGGGAPPSPRDGKRRDGKDRPEEPDRKGKLPDDGKDGKKGRPEIPIPRLPFGGRPREETPQIAKEHFESGEPGFVNYYFNRENQQRLWTRLAARGDFSSLSGGWMLAGKWNGGAGDFKIELSSKGAKIELPTGDTSIDVADDLSEELNPPGSGGMLTTLWLWRKYLVLGPKKFGKLDYSGMRPLVGYAGLYDVLHGTAEGVDCYFYFDPASGLIAAAEMYSSETDADPCEIYFREYQEISGRPVPKIMEVRFGDNLFGLFAIDKVNLEDSAPNAAPAASDQGDATKDARDEVKPDEAKPDNTRADEPSADKPTDDNQKADKATAPSSDSSKPQPDSEKKPGTEPVKSSSEEGLE